MTVGAWLSACRPVAPPELGARVRSAIGDQWSADTTETSRVCEEAAEDLLRSLLERQQTGRESALDLLAADALVTYAFEYTALTGGDLDAEAGAAMRRIAAIGARCAASSGVT